MTTGRQVSAVITDLDGTLLSSGKQVSDRTAQALQLARQGGALLVAATARPWRQAQLALGDSLPLFDAVIVTNGALVIDPVSGRGLREASLPAERARQAIHRLAELPKIGFGWEGLDGFECDAQFAAIAQTQTVLRDIGPIRATPTGAVYQLVAARAGLVPHDYLMHCVELLGPQVDVTDSEGGVVEIAHPQATKASAAAWFVEGRGVASGNTVAFGDQHNDLGLLTWAGRGYAMANALPELQAVAAAIAPSNDDHGVAVVLEQLHEQGWTL